MQTRAVYGSFEGPGVASVCEGQTRRVDTTAVWLCAIVGGQPAGGSIGSYREIAIAIESEAGDSLT